MTLWPCVFVPLVPSPVKDLGISPNPNSLLISWSRGSGNVEQYRLVLMDKGAIVQDTNVDRRDTSYAFHELTPGHLYNLTIVTMASGLQNSRWKLVRTGEFLLFCSAKAKFKLSLNPVCCLDNGTVGQIDIHVSYRKTLTFIHLREEK